MYELTYVFSVDPSCCIPVKYAFPIINLFMAFGNATCFVRSSRVTASFEPAAPIHWIPVMTLDEPQLS